MGGGDAATDDTRGLGHAAEARSASFLRETRFALAPHVFSCVDGSHVVLLDLKRDEYYALDLSVAADPLLVSESLLRLGLLVQSPAKDRRMDPSHVQGARADFQMLTADSTRPGVRDVVQVARAALKAALLLRCRSLERIIRRTQSRKRRRPATRVKYETLAGLIGRFERLRPLFFSARDQCLLESLALLEFLAGHDIHADWIFGVRTRPFAAHCWVQVDDSVCNDTVERVCRFTPILVA